MNAITKTIVWYGPCAEWTLKLPAKNAVCSRCEGRGTHVNPNVDGNGLSPDDPELDSDFWESYFSGVYDVRCEECNGEKVVPIVDKSRLTRRQRLIYNDYLKQEERDAQERARDAFNRSLGIQY